MSLIRLQPSHALQTLPGATKADGGGKSAVATADANVADSVRLSLRGRTLSKIAGPMPPSVDSARKLSTALADNLRHLLRATPVDPRCGVGIEVDSRTGQVSVQGSQPDAQRVAALIDSQPAIARQIQDLSTLSAHVVAAEQEDTTSRASAVARRAAQIGSVIASYASRFSNTHDVQDLPLTPLPRIEDNAAIDNRVSTYKVISTTAGTARDVAITFDGTAIRVDVNGRQWISTRA